MTRSENSVLIALTELQTMERERSEHVLQQRKAEQERRLLAEQEREQIALDARRRHAAEQEARRLETERRQASEATEARLRIERAEAKARAEHNARLADVQRELSAALDRREMRRTGRVAAFGLGTALLASVTAIAVWVGMSRPIEPPRIAAAVPDIAVDVDALAHRLAELRSDNAALRGDLREIQARASVATAIDHETAESESTITDEPSVRPRRPHPRPTSRTKPKAKPKANESATNKRTNPLVFDGDGDLLAGLEKKPK